MKWIFLRGLGREARHWGDFPQRFAAHLGAQALTPDLPGFGQEPGPFPLTIKEAVHNLRQRFPDDGPPRAIFAMSLGGMVALEWLAQAPSSFQHAVLVNTSLRGLNTATQRLRPRALWQMLQMVATRAPEERERRALELTSDKPHKRQAAHANWVNIAKENGASRAQVLRQMLAAASYRAPALTRTPPTLVLAGGRDRIVHPSCSATLARHYGFELRQQESAGHDLALDAPDWCMATVDAWLAS